MMLYGSHLVIGGAKSNQAALVTLAAPLDICSFEYFDSSIYFGWGRKISHIL